MPSLSRYLGKLSAAQYKFSGDPIKLHREDYEEAKERFLLQVTRHPGIQSIYQIGEIGVLGISDLDFITIFRPEASLLESSISLLPKRLQYILLHEQFFVPASIAPKIQLATSIFNIHRVFGEEIDYAQANDFLGNRLSILEDQLFFVAPRQYLLPLLRRKIDIRMMLARLNSFKYIVKLYDAAIGTPKEEWLEFTHQINDFRNSWFTLGSDRFQLLLNFVDLAVQHSFEMIQGYHEALPPSTLSGEYRHPWLYTRFSSLWNPDLALKFSVQAFTRSRLQAVLLPSRLGEHLASYSLENGPLSSLLRDRLTLGIMAESANPSSLERIHFMNQHVTLLQTKGMPYGWFFDFGTPPRQTVKQNIKFSIQETLFYLKKQAIRL